MTSCRGSGDYLVEGVDMFLQGPVCVLEFFYQLTGSHNDSCGKLPAARSQILVLTVGAWRALDRLFRGFVLQKAGLQVSFR